MELTYSEKYRDLQSEVRAFIAKHGHLSPKPGGGRQKPSEKALVWQRCCWSTVTSHGASRGVRGIWPAARCAGAGRSSPRRSPRLDVYPAS